MVRNLQVLKNLTDKHIQDLKNKSLSNQSEKLTDAFRYTAYQELMGDDLGIKIIKIKN